MSFNITCLKSYLNITQNTLMNTLMQCPFQQELRTFCTREHKSFPQGLVNINQRTLQLPLVSSTPHINVVDGGYYSKGVGCCCLLITPLGRKKKLYGVSTIALRTHPLTVEITERVLAVPIKGALKIQISREPLQFPVVYTQIQLRFMCLLNTTSQSRELQLSRVK